MSARTHRIASLAFFLLLIPGLAIQSAGVEEQTWMGAAAVAMIVCGGIGTCPVMVSRYTRWAMADDKELDERERFVRDRARLIAFQLLSSLLFFGFLAHTALELGFGVALTPDGSDLGFVLLVLSGVTVALPGTVLAWLERDPPTADVDPAVIPGRTP